MAFWHSVIRTAAAAATSSAERGSRGWAALCAGQAAATGSTACPAVVGRAGTRLTPSQRSTAHGTAARRPPNRRREYCTRSPSRSQAILAERGRLPADDPRRRVAGAHLAVERRQTGGLADLVLVERFLRQQHLGQRFQVRALATEQLVRPRIALLDDPSRLVVHRRRERLAVLAPDGPRAGR